VDPGQVFLAVSRLGLEGGCDPRGLRVDPADRPGSADVILTGHLRRAFDAEAPFAETFSLVEKTEFHFSGVPRGVSH